MPALPRPQAAQDPARQTHHQKETQVNPYLANWTDEKRAKLLQTVADKFASGVKTDPTLDDQLNGLIELAGIDQESLSDSGRCIVTRQQLITLIVLSAVTYKLGGDE